MSKQKKIASKPTSAASVWVKMRNKLSHFCEAYGLSKDTSPDFWATVYTYGDGDFLYKFGRRIGDKIPDKVFVYYSDGHTHHKIKGDSYNTLAEAQKACLQHIARVIKDNGNRSREEEKQRRRHKEMQLERSANFHDFGYRGKNKYGYDEDGLDCTGRCINQKPLTRREQLDKSAEHSIGGECYASNEHYIVEPEPLFEVKFGKVNRYGECHTHIEGLRLPVSNISCREQTLIHIWLKIDGVKQRFHLLFHDAGTIGYARMAGGLAIGGRLTNLSISWGSKHDRHEVAMPHLIGTTKHGVFSGCIWYTTSKAKSRRHQESSKRKKAGKNKPRRINALKRAKANEGRDIEAMITELERKRKVA